MKGEMIIIFDHNATLHTLIELEIQEFTKNFVLIGTLTLSFPIIVQKVTEEQNVVSV